MKSLEIVNYCLENINKGENVHIFEYEFQQIKADLEVLQIIKKKNVDIKNLRIYIKTFGHDKDLLSAYNVGLNEEYHLTMEELLKIKKWLEENEE